MMAGRHRPPHPQRGGLSVVATLTLFVSVLFLLVAVNTGNGLYMRDRTADVAGMLAMPALVNQLTYREENPARSTPRLLREILRQAGTADQLGTLGTGYQVEYQFGRYDGGGFHPLEAEECECDPRDPDPAEDDFNAVALEVRAPLSGLGGVERYFDIDWPTVRGRALYALDPDQVHDCYCRQYCSTSLLGLVTCVGCETGYTLWTALRWLFTDPGADLGEALRCLLESVVLVADTAWDWVFGDGSVTLADRG